MAPEINQRILSMKILRERLFLFIAFFLGTWGAVYNIAFTITIFLSLAINVWGDIPAFYADMKKERFYIGAPLLFVLYILGFSLVHHLLGKEIAKPHFGTIEALLFFFQLVLLYALSLKRILTPELLKRFLFIFCLGVFLFNLLAIFQLAGFSIITDTGTALDELYVSRFGGNKHIFGSSIYLEAQALYIAVAALISYFFFFIERRTVYRVIHVFLFFSLLFFLSITVTKGSIIGFLLAFLFFNIVFLWNISLKYKSTLMVGLLLIGAVGSMVLSDTYEFRMEEAKKEIVDIMNDNLQGGTTITPRYSLIKVCMEHLDEYGVFGLGVYSKSVTKKWYVDSGYGIGHLTHSHNSFLQYWLIGGIFGLFFIFNLFFKPIWGMIRDKKYSFFIVSMLLLFFVPNNTSVLLVLSDSTSFIVLFLAMFYLYREQFFELESQRRFK